MLQSQGAYTPAEHPCKQQLSREVPIWLPFKFPAKLRNRHKPSGGNVGIIN